MSNQIRLKRGSGSDPSASDLVTGEVAVRTDNGKLFTKKDDNSVVEISGGVEDGDITTSKIADDAVTYAKIQNVSATNRILGRDSSGAGVIEEITPANLRTMINVEDGATADQTASEILTLIKTVDGAGSGLNADLLDGISSASFVRSDADDSFSGTITANSDATNPIIKVQGAGPNFIQFASDSSGTVDADSINFVYRTGANTLGFERASDDASLFTVDADNGQAIFSGNLDVGAGLDVTGNITVSGTVDGRDLATDGSKLDGIASGATNVTNTNQLTNGAGFITATLTNEQVQDIVGGMVSGNTESGITVTYQDGDGTLDFSVASQTDNNFTNADHSKLDGIEAGATADQSASEILTLLKTVDGSGSGLDADTLQGASPSVSAGSNTIVKRHSAGYIFANYFNTTANDVSSGVTKVMVETGNDNYIRHGTADAVRTFINVENGATADQSASEILTLIKTVDGSGSGLDADTVDGIQATNFLRSDQADTASGDITFNGGAGAATIAAHSDIRFTNGNWTGNATKIQQHANRLYIVGGSDGIMFREDGTDRWHIDGSGHFDPNTDSTYDIGQSDRRVRNGYFDTLYGDGSNLTGISAGATGGGSDEVFYENDQTVTSNYTITNGKNAMAAGPITINSGVTVTVGSGETLTIV